jgi:D-alanine-D-alanine ligase
MKIGLTYDLRDDYRKMGYSDEETAEFDKIDTIEALEQVLTSQGFETERIGHVMNLAGALSAGKKWDLVFNIAEGMFGIGREAQVPALLDAYQIPYVFSDPMVMSLCLHKGMTKHIIRDIGVPTPAFAVVTNEADIERIDLAYPLFAKPVAEGTGKGVTPFSRIHTPEELRQTASDLLMKFKQPVLVERYLPGREFTVGVVGTGAAARCVGVMEIHYGENPAGNIYTYYNKQNYHEMMSYSMVSGEMAQKCGEVAVAAWRGLTCRDGGRIDLRLDEAGVPNFIEVNPLAGLNPIDSDLPIIYRLQHIPYARLIMDIVESALARLEL